VRSKQTLMIPGEYILAKEDIIANEGRPTIKIVVINTGDRPVQVGSHFHFFEVNKQLRLERAAAFGMRLNIPAGTAVRFEPGEEKEVELVTFGGKKNSFGFSNLTNGSMDVTNKEVSLAKAESLNFKNI
jgi:urease subunit beta